MRKGNFFGVPEIKVGSYWVCKPVFYTNLASTDIFAKVLKVTETKVFLARKSQYGFEDLSPVSMEINEFIELYFKLED